jgi:hypothetical protein
MTDLQRPGDIGFYLNNPFVIFYTALRIAAAVLILFNPVAGFIATLFFDYWDGYFYEMLPKLVEMPRPTYQKYDKMQDWFGYVTMWIVSFNYGIFPVLTLLLIYRLIGQIIYLKVKKQFVFVIFTNFFEAVFLWSVIFPLANIKPVFTWLYVLLIVYILREVFLHIYWPRRLKKHGYPKFLHIIGVRKEALW